jgi:hypothetical protein
MLAKFRILSGSKTKRIVNSDETRHLELRDGAPKEAREASEVRCGQHGDSVMFTKIYQANQSFGRMVFRLVW